MPLVVNAPLVLDASAALVLFASGHIRNILQSLPMPVFAVQETIDECQFLRAGDPAGQSSKKEAIPWRQILSDGTISLLDRSDVQEFAHFVRFASSVDDGEAAAAAAALHRGYGLVIDDRKVRRVFAPELTLIWSLDLLRHWCDSEQLQTQAIGAILSDVRRKATYHPHSAHPLMGWWQQHIVQD